jgi:large subunit ribosomal protein L24e
MAASREKLLAHRQKVHVKASKVSTSLVEPISFDSVSKGLVRRKVRVPVKSSRSALVPSEGKSMGMEVD